MIDAADDVAAARARTTSMAQLPTVLRVALAIQTGDPDGYALAGGMIDGLASDRRAVPHRRAAHALGTRAAPAR